MMKAVKGNSYCHESKSSDHGPQQRNSTRKRKGHEKKEFNIGTWNVRTLLKAGKHSELLIVLANYKMEITALQEIRWQGKDIIRDKKHQTDLYYSCSDKTGALGCGFAICGKMRDNVIGWNPINERMCSIRIKGIFNNYSLICVHAPTDVEKDPNAKDAFYDQLDRAYDSCPEYDTKLVLGDLNAQIGCGRVFDGTVGRHSLKATNKTKTRRFVKAEDCVTTDNGIRFISFAASRNMVISSTFFRRKEIHKATWTAPDGVTMTQIDHIAIDKRHASSILDVRSMRGAEIGSDHFLVKTKFRARISTKNQGKTTTSNRHHINALKQPSIAQEYATSLDNELMKIDTTTMSIEEHWNQVSEAITNTASRILGKAPPMRRKPWFDTECEEALVSKNEARSKWLQASTRSTTRLTYKVFSDERKRVYRLFRSKRREHEEQQVREIQGYRNTKDMRKFFNKINSQRSRPKKVTFPCKDKNNNLLLSADVAMKRWAEYFRDTLNGDGDAAETSMAALQKPPVYDDHVIETPSIAEVRTAIQRLKNNKSAGLDNIPAELLKFGGEGVANHIHQIIAKIWTDETWIEEWNCSWINPIHKKGDKTLCSNYRGISILNVAYKIFSTILCDRLKPYLNDIIGSYQCGFRPGKSTTDQIFTLRRLLEKTLEFQVDTHHLFIDFKQAYDSIKRDSLFTTMQSFGIPSKLNRLCWLTLAKTVSTVRIGNETSEQFTTKQGFRQGDALSCDFFNLCLEKIIRDSEDPYCKRGCIYNKSCQILGYADDIDIIGRRKEDVEKNFVEIEKAAEVIGLRVNSSKTKYMRGSRNTSMSQNTCQNVTIGQHNFEVVKDFVYLGSSVNTSNNTSEEIIRRIVVGSRCLFGLSKLLRSKHLSRKTKIQIYLTLILPIVMYGSESWELKEADCERLLVFERRVLRIIFGPVSINGDWRSRYNDELYNLYTDETIVQKIKAQRLRWLGHVFRMDDSAPQKTCLFSKPGNDNRGKGRPKARWMDSVDKDLTKLRVKSTWKRKAADRDEWRNLIQQAKTHKAL
ncbi:MAG: reverse transcriptase domain-containing protein [Janthinobacterium lividum]